MPISITCPDCSSRMKAPEAAAGRSVKCPECGAGLVVPKTVVSNTESPGQPASDEQQPAERKPRAKAVVQVEEYDPQEERQSERQRPASRKPRVKTDVVVDEDDKQEERPRKAARKKATEEKRAGGVPFWGKAAIAVIFAIVSIGVVVYLSGVFSNGASQPVAIAAANEDPAQASVPHDVPVAPPAKPRAPNKPPALYPEATDEELFDPKVRVFGLVTQGLDDLTAALPPIPQDKERMEEVLAAYKQWHRKMLVDQFDRLYPKDGPGAVQAREGLQLKAEELLYDSISGASVRVLNMRESPSKAALDAAVAAGCTDPIVRYFQFQKRVLQGHFKEGEYLQGVRPLVLEVWKSNYPDFRKLHAVHNLLAGLDPKDPAQLEEIRTWDPRYWETFERLCQEADRITQTEIVELAQLRQTDQIRIRRTRDQAFEEIVEHLVKARAPMYTVLAIRGMFLVNYAWDARGSGLANTVTEMGFKLMSERLQEAEDVLTKAYKLDPTRHEAPAAMILVCMGLGHDAGTMEKWFARSMTANPFDHVACWNKLEYLHPKWHGSLDKWIGFGWQCVKTRNMVGRLPLATLTDYFLNYDFLQPMTQENYKKLLRIYGDHRCYHTLHAAISLQLRERPELKQYRGMHVRLACLAGDYNVAGAEITRLNGDFTGGGFKSQSEFDFFRNWAESHRPPYPAH